MKRLCFLLCLSLLLLPSLTVAAELPRLTADARITAVTVYPDRALTTRSASLKLKPGSYLIVFDALPTLVQDDSVRVEGKGSAAVTIAGIEVKRDYLEGSGEEQVQKLDAAIRDQQQKLANLEAKKSGLAAQKAFLESIRVAWGERISKELAIGKPTAAELQEASTLVGNGVSKLGEQSVAIEAEKSVIKDKIDALTRQREETIGSESKESKRVEVMVDVAREGNLTLTVGTVVSQAGWVPTYDVRLAGGARTAALTFRALVRQQTGEDWKNVEVTLSTARPASGSAPPELLPWHIAIVRPQPREDVTMYREAMSPPPRMKMAMMAEESAMVADAEVQAAVETALLADEQSSVAFRIPRPLDIPADGSQHGSVVAVVELPVSMEFLAIPKLSPAVFLKAQIVNQGDFPLLPGKVNTFTGNTYTGSTQLQKVAAGESFDLFFGSDDQITVKREELKIHKEAGLFSGNRASYRYRIEVQNFRKEAVTVSLRDQLPLAADAEIKVALDAPSIKPNESGSDGELTWNLPLAAGEKKELTFGITVDYPKEREISGL